MKGRLRERRARYAMRWLDALADYPDGRGPRSLLSRFLMEHGMCRRSAITRARDWSNWLVRRGLVVEDGHTTLVGAHPTVAYKLTDAGYAAVLHETLEAA